MEYNPAPFFRELHENGYEGERIDVPVLKIYDGGYNKWAVEWAEGGMGGWLSDELYNLKGELAGFEKKDARLLRDYDNGKYAYLFKVWLQKKYEAMILGRQSVKILKGDTRTKEEEDSEEMLTELAKMLYLKFEEIFSGGDLEDKDLRHLREIYHFQNAFRGIYVFNFGHVATGPKPEYLGLNRNPIQMWTTLIDAAISIDDIEECVQKFQEMGSEEVGYFERKLQRDLSQKVGELEEAEVESGPADGGFEGWEKPEWMKPGSRNPSIDSVLGVSRREALFQIYTAVEISGEKDLKPWEHDELANHDVLWQVCRTVVECIVSEARRKVTTYKDGEKRTIRSVRYSLPGVVLLRKLIGKLAPILGEATMSFGRIYAGDGAIRFKDEAPKTGLLDGKDESIEELFSFIDPEENNPFIKRYRYLTDALDLKTTYQETMAGGMLEESHFGGTKGKGRRSSKWGEWPFDVRREFVLEHNVLRFSSNLLNLLVIKGWIHIDNGEFQDVVDFFGESEEDVVHRELNWQGSPPNMIRFGPVLNKILVLPHMEDEHAIFRTLRQDPKRWMYCQPEPHHFEWERPYRNLGGYLSRGLRNSIMSSSQYDRMAKLKDQLGRSEFPIRTELGSDTRRALNHLQNTQWEVNLDFVEVIAAAHDSDGYVFRQPIREQVVQWKGFAFRPWLESSREREDSGRLGEKWEKWDHTLNNARKAIRNVGNVFWHPWACDWRGRLYSSTAQMSPIGDDLDKALIRFKEWKTLGKKGIFWLRVHACNLMSGEVWSKNTYEWKNHRSASNKVSFKERNQWTIDNIDTLRGIAQGFCREKIIDAGFTPDEEFLKILGLDKQPRSGDDAFQRLAVLLELDRVYSVFDTVKDWDKVTSGQPVYLDASCNGFQHAAALLRDGSLAKSVNVLRSEDDGGGQSDLYQEVASFAKRAYKNVDVKTSLRLEIESNPGLYGEPGRWERIFTRKLMKGPTMVYTYGAKDLEKCFINRDGKGEPGWRQLEPLTVEGVKEYPSRCQKFRKGTFGKEQQEECGVVFNSKQEYVEHMNSQHGWAVRLHPNSPLRDEISKGGVWNVWNGPGRRWKEAKGLVKIDIEFDEWRMMVDEENGSLLDDVDASWSWPDHVEDAMMRVARKLTRDVQTAIDCVTDDAYEKLGLRTLVKTQENCEPRGGDDWINEATIARKKQLSEVLAGSFAKVGGGNADWDKLRLYSMGWRNHMCWTAGPIVLNQVITKDEVDETSDTAKYFAPKYGSHGIPTHTVITNMHAELGEKDRPRAWKLFDIVDEDKISKAELVRRISSFLDEMNIQIHGVEDAITIGKENQDSTGKPHYDEKMERVIGRMQNKLRDLYYNSKEQSVVEKSREFLLRLSNRKKITISSLEGVSHDGKVRDKGSSTPGSKARRRGVTPQFIHSHDAAHMVMTICGLADNNIDDIWIVHDCFGAHACHMDSLLSVVNESFVNLHKNENFGDKLLQIDPWFNLHGQDGFYDYGMTDNGKMHVLVLQESQKPLHELSRGELIHELQKRRIPWDGYIDDNDLISRLVRMYFNYRFSTKLLLHSVKVTRDKSGGAAEIFMDEVSEKDIDKYDARGQQILIKLMNSADCKDAYFDYLVMKQEIELALYVIATMGQKAVKEPSKRKLSNLEDARKFRQNHDWLNAAKEILLIKPTLEPLIEAKEKFEQITGEHLRGMTAVELRKQLKDFGLKTTGNKGDLISRLVRYELRNDRSMLPPSHRNLGRDNDDGEIEMLDIKDAINAEFLIS